MATVIVTREERGRMIAEKANQIQRLGERFYTVTSQSGHGMYNVTKARMNKTIGWVCDCPDWTYRQVKCKHIWAVEISLKLREAIQHIRHVRMSGDNNNNRMERFNGELRDREKVTRNLKKSDTPILTGMQIFHNYLRPHMALDGQTPAEKAGILVKGQNKWLTIIQNASTEGA